MDSVSGNPQDIVRNDNTPDAGMSSPESDTFVDVLPEDNNASDAPVDIHDVSVDVDMTSPQAYTYTEDLLTPPTSSFAPSVHAASPLPRPRRTPLQPGGSKETNLIFYLDKALDNVAKRIRNRHVTELLPGEVGGYKSFAELVKDIDPLVDVVWVSGTPTIQLPYLINMTVIIINSMADMPPLPRTTLNFLSKLDTAFAALIRGRDPETNDPLPGFTNNRGISTTDKVRLKGLVERARSTATKHLVGQDDEEGVEVNRKDDRDEKRDEGFVKFEGFEEDDSDEEEYRHSDERGVARVFEKTLVELGDMLGGEMIGIVTDEEEDMRKQYEEQIAALREQAQLRPEQLEDEELREQRQYLADGMDEFEEEAAAAGYSHGFKPHGKHSGIEGVE